MSLMQLCQEAARTTRARAAAGAEAASGSGAGGRAPKRRGDGAKSPTTARRQAPKPKLLGVTAGADGLARCADVRAASPVAAACAAPRAMSLSALPRGRGSVAAGPNSASWGRLEVRCACALPGDALASSGRATRDSAAGPAFLRLRLCLRGPRRTGAPLARPPQTRHAPPKPREFKRPRPTGAPGARCTLARALTPTSGAFAAIAILL